MKPLRRHLAVVLLVAFGLGFNNVFAQLYPSRAIRIVLPMSPGGQSDTIARAIAEKLSDVWKQPVVIENRPGAGGNVGSNAVAQAKPDGYTLLINTSGLAVSPSIYRSLPFDPVKDFAPVTQIHAAFLIMAVNANVPATTVAEFIRLAKSQPGRMNYASSGPGGTPHLAGELFKSITGTDIVHIAYKGVAPMNTALMTNEVQAVFTTQEGVMPYVKSGKLRVLAMTGKARSPVLPEVPTMAEAGLREFELPSWLGLFAPVGTPHEIIATLQTEIGRILAMPDVRERILRMGNEPVGNTPEEFAAMYRSDVARFARIVKEVARITPQD